jgi:capsular exopolysaccharide synthesis family protein
MWLRRSKKDQDRYLAYARPRGLEVPQTDRPDSRRAKTIALDNKGLAKRGLITPSTMDAELTQQFSLVKRRLFRRLDFFNHGVGGAAGAKADEPRPTVLVTSTKPGEGKTFSSANLALSLAIEEQLDVLLIDADLAKPSMPEMFGYPDNLKGLFDCLVDPKTKLSDVVIGLDKISLSILPAGQATTSPAPLFGSSAFSDLLCDVTTGPNAYGIVLMDGPPLLATTEAAVLSPHVDEVVLVVGAGDTSRRELGAALDLLDAPNRISLLLNRATFTDKVTHNYNYGAAAA